MVGTENLNVGHVVQFYGRDEERDDLLRISVRDRAPLRGNELRAAPLHGLGRWTRWPSGGG